jgi:hypothetical protein
MVYNQFLDMTVQPWHDVVTKVINFHPSKLNDFSVRNYANTDFVEVCIDVVIQLQHVPPVYVILGVLVQVEYN